ncbi:DUF4019 domain-containing protein [Flavisphingomonas formosensis]|uniref:DUF4019 domain-containing protein n=1 Tax=Flavisphingomonas formosensis TaxID=861534 RepID=UPI0018DF57CA|nr:DUF4019 domain-containing protein [Sphingomonas formosensis]
MLIAGMFVLAGCSAGKDLPLAEQGVTDFHKKLDAGQFDALYAAAGDDLKRSATAATWDQLLAAVHRKLGAFKSGSSAGWNDNFTPSGHFLYLNYASDYERGKAQENFAFRITGGKALLVGYHVNSDALILN